MTVLGWRGRSVEVVADGPADDRWLTWWCAPTFAPADAATTGRVRVVRDAGLLARRRAEVADGIAQPIVVGTLDQGPLTLPGTRCGDALVIADDDRGAVLTIDGSGEVEVVAAPGDARARLTLLRVVRELLVHPDPSLLHAAAVEVDGRAIVLVGARRAGKTTLLLHLLVHAGARPIANDCVAVADGAVHGVPTVVRVRPSSADLVTAPSLVPHRSFVLLPDEPVVDVRPSSAEGWHLAPPDLAARFGTSVAASAPLGAILVLDRQTLSAARFGTAMPPTALHRAPRAPAAIEAPVRHVTVGAEDLADPTHAVDLVAEALGRTAVGR